MTWWKNEKDLSRRISEVVKDYAFDERMKVRVEAASKAKKLVEGKLGNLAEEDIQELLRLADRDLWGGKIRKNRFGITFLGKNSIEISSQAVKVNEWIKALWGAEPDDCFELVDRFVKDQPIKSARRGFVSYILYIKDPDYFSVWLPAVIETAELLDEKEYDFYTGKAYQEYTEWVVGFRKTHNLNPHSTDIVLYQLRILIKETLAKVETGKSFLAVLRRYHSNNIIFQSSEKDARYCIQSVDDKGCEVRRLDAEKPARCTLSELEGKLDRLRNSSNEMPFTKFDGTAAIRNTYLQSPILALSPDKKSIKYVGTAKEALDLFCKVLRELRVDTDGGIEKIYEPVMLACLIEGIEEGDLKDNRIEFDWIAPRFIEKMAKLGEDVTERKAAMPFIHLRRDLFWFHSYNNVEDWVKDGGQGPSAIRRHISCACIKDTFWDVLQDEENRNICLETLADRWWPKGVVRGVGMKNIEKLKQVFLNYMKSNKEADSPGFESFESPGPFYLETEYSYKEEASKLLREMFLPWVEDTPDSMSEADFTSGLKTVLVDKLPDSNWPQNLTNWRDHQILFKEILSDKPSVRAFMNLLHALLKRVESGENIDDELGGLLGWMESTGCRAGMTKSIPSLLLYYWNPDRFVFIKPRIFDQFLKAIGEKRLGDGVFMTPALYSRVLSTMEQLRQEISDLKPKNMIDLQGFYYLTMVVDDQTAPPPIDVDDTPEIFPETLPLNLILYGPPGTGKTYLLNNDYIPIFTSKKVMTTKESFLHKIAGELSWFEVVTIALLDLGSGRVPEIYEHELIKAKETLMSRKNVKAAMWNVLQVHTKEDCPHVNVTARQEPLLFEKDSDSVWSVDELIVKNEYPDHLEIVESIRNFVPGEEEARRYSFITFHQSYSYEEFVEGIKPLVNEDEGGSVGYAVVDGVFKQAVEMARRDPARRYAILIDEINRANISKVFGELITLLEPDKRMTWNPERNEWEGGIQVKLPYTHSQNPSAPLFGVPENLHVIGAMNTADRSIALLDTALRRRFDFREMMPKPELLAKNVITIEGSNEVIELEKLLEAINERIEFLYDRDHQLGHSYFMNIQNFEDLERIFLKRVIPLLQEYFYDDFEKIQMVFNDLADDDTDSDGNPKARGDAIINYRIPGTRSLLGISASGIGSRRIYEVPEQIQPESILKIYK